MTLAGVLDEFRAAIAAAGLPPPALVVPDGKLHRFPTSRRRGDDAGWYTFHGDGIPAGAFGDWRSGLRVRWRASSGRRLTPAERERIERARRARAAEAERREAQAGERARRIWQEAVPAPDAHPYLVAKRVRAHGLRLRGRALVVPMRDGAELHSLQFIDAEGRKRFLAGGRVSGCYCPIGKPEAALLIAEGYATGASIFEATGCAVAVAFCAGNLLPVARALRARYPQAPIVVCADDDVSTPGNPGLRAAIATARAVGGVVAVPDFGPSRPEGATDFNDLCRLAGPEAVRSCIRAALPPARPILTSRSTRP